LYCNISLFAQGVDAAALLRLYLNYDLLEEAAELVLEYVDALLGKGHQYFGIEVHYSRGSQTVSLWPTSSIGEHPVTPWTLHT
jgi:nuclear pore complex protein Nup160